MKIMIIDDHALLRAGLALLVRELGDDVEVCEADSAEAGLACTAVCAKVDLVLIDINLPGLSGIEGLLVFRRRFPDCRVVVLTGNDACEPMRQSLDYGARGYIHKSATADAMLAALHKVLDGQIGICAPPPCDELAQRATAAVAALTPRQVEVLSGLCQGKTNKEIARELGMSENTVRVHLAGVFRALDAKTRTQAAMLARQQGLV